MCNSLILALTFVVTVCGAQRTLTFGQPDFLVPGKVFDIPITATTNARDGEQITHFQVQCSTDGGTTYTTLHQLDTKLGSAIRRMAQGLAGQLGTTVVIRARATFTGGQDGAVGYSGAADTGGWQQPQARYAYIRVAFAPAKAIYISSPSTLIYGTSYTATATGGSGTGQVVWALGANSTAAGAAIDAQTGQVTAAGIGTVAIKAYRKGDQHYAPSATTGDFEIQVTPRPLTVIVGGSRIYDGTTNVGAVSVISAGSLAPADDITFSYTPAPSPDAGDYPGRAHATVTSGTAPLNRTANYRITYTGDYHVTPAGQPPVQITSPLVATYGMPYTATASGGAGNGDLSWELGQGSTAAHATIDPTTGVATSRGIGTISIRAYRAADRNHLPSTPTPNFTVTILPLPITVTLDGFRGYDTQATSTGATAAITAGTLGAGDEVTYQFKTPAREAGYYSDLTLVSISNPQMPRDRTRNYQITYRGVYSIIDPDRPAAD